MLEFRGAGLAHLTPRSHTRAGRLWGPLWARGSWGALCRPFQEAGAPIAPLGKDALRSVYPLPSPRVSQQSGGPSARAPGSEAQVHCLQHPQPTRSAPLAVGVSSWSPGPGGPSFIPFLRGTAAHRGRSSQATGSCRAVPGGAMTFWTACGPQTGIHARAQPPAGRHQAWGLVKPLVQTGWASSLGTLTQSHDCRPPCLLSPTGRQPGLGTGRRWALWCGGREGGEDRLSGGPERRPAEAGGSGQRAEGWEARRSQAAGVMHGRGAPAPDAGAVSGARAGQVTPQHGGWCPWEVGRCTPGWCQGVTLAGPGGDTPVPGDGLPPTTAVLCLLGRDTTEFRQGPGARSLYSLLPSVPGLNGPYPLPGWVSVSRQLRGASSW